MIWSNLVAASPLMAIAAAGVTRSARLRMSATMISLPSPFILRNGALDIAGLREFARVYGGTVVQLPVQAHSGAVNRGNRNHQPRNKEVQMPRLLRLLAFLAVLLAS